MTRRKRCPYCGVLYARAKHTCAMTAPTTRQAWSALLAADAEQVEQARAEFARALERVGS